MLALTLVLMTLTTAALAVDDPGLYSIGDEAIPENLTGHTRIYNAVDAAPGWRYGFVAYLTDGTRVSSAYTYSFGNSIRPTKTRCPSLTSR